MFDAVCDASETSAAEAEIVFDGKTDFCISLFADLLRASRGTLPDGLVPGKGAGELPGLPIESAAVAVARPALSFGEASVRDPVLSLMLLSGSESGEERVGIPAPGELSNGLNKDPLMGDTDTGGDVEAPEGGGPDPVEETTSVVSPETTSEVDIPADADGETTPGVDVPTEEAPEGGIVEIAAELEPLLGTEVVLAGEPTAGVDRSVGLPSDGVSGSCADSAADGEIPAGVDRPPGIGETVGDIAGVVRGPSSGLGFDMKETRIEPPQGADENVGDQPGEKTSGSVGVTLGLDAEPRLRVVTVVVEPLAGVEAEADTEAVADGEVAGDDMPSGGNGSVDGDPLPAGVMKPVLRPGEVGKLAV